MGEPEIGAPGDIPEEEKGDLIGGKVLEHRFEWITGTRRVKYAEMDIELEDGTQETVKIQPLVDFQRMN